MAPEPIVKQDGSNKNDCERNAGKRLLEKIRQDHPRLPIIVVEDGLSSNAPHIRLLKQLDMRVLLIVKQDDHEYLFEEFLRADGEDRITSFSYPHPTRTGGTCEISFVHDLPLNKSNQDLHVNLLMYSEYAPDGTRQKHFTWITDLTIARENAAYLVAGGRARWKIENETFNTLKNQGIISNTTMGMDSKIYRSCPLWERLRSHFYHFLFPSMRELLVALLHDCVKETPLPPRYPPRRICSCHLPSG